MSDDIFCKRCGCDIFECGGASSYPEAKCTRLPDPGINKWDAHFLKMAELVSQQSKDPSTKTGAVIVNADCNRVISTGYNGFPACMEDKPQWYTDRSEKLSRIVHAEMNAMIYAQRELHGCILYTWPWMPCDRCAVHLLQAGIYRFVARRATGDRATRWAAEFERTRSYIKDCGCELLEVDQ